MDPVHPAAPAQEERRTGSLLQRPDHRAGEEVRDAEVSVSSREKETRQDAAAQRETGESTRQHSSLPQPKLQNMSNS